MSGTNLCRSLNYKIIVNPTAGNGRAGDLLPGIKKYFSSAGCNFSIYLTSAPGEAVAVSRRSILEGYDVVVAVGGDGTVNEVVNGLASAEVPGETPGLLGVIPGGTGNDFAEALEIPPNLTEACRILFQAEFTSIDLGQVIDRYFVNVVGVGFDGAVSHTVNQISKFLPGSSSYILAALKNLFFYQTQPVEIHLDDRKLQCTPLLIAVGNGRSYGGGMQVVPGAVMDDGYFDICIIEDLPRMKVIPNLARVFSGQHTEMEEVSIYRSRRVKLKASEPLPLHIDGEDFCSREMEFTLRSSSLKVIK